MTIASGTKLGPYEILASIGAGGIGEVYRAKDTRLGRTVAIKVLNKAHMERFEREARAIAALNHPNISTLHDIGPDYLVMEFVDAAVLTLDLPMMRLASLEHVVGFAEVAWLALPEAMLIAKSAVRLPKSLAEALVWIWALIFFLKLSAS